MTRIRILLLACLAALAPCGADAATAVAGGASPAQARPADRVEATFAAWDSNKDHVLSLAEFQAGWAALQKATAIEVRLHRQFQAVDADHDGTLEAGEYANLVLVKRAGTGAPPLSAFDANKDQRLQFPEYLALVRKLGAQPAAAPAAGK